MKYEIEIRNPLTGAFIDILEGDTDTLSAEQQEKWFGRTMPPTPPEEREEKQMLSPPKKKGVGRGVKKGSKRGSYRKDSEEGMTPNSLADLAAFYQNPANEGEGKSFFGEELHY